MPELVWPLAPEGVPEKLVEAARKQSAACGIGMVFVSGNPDFSEFWGQQSQKPWTDPKWPGRTVVVWFAQAMDPGRLLSWRGRLVEEEEISAFRILVVRKQDEVGNWGSWLSEALGDWARPRCQREDRQFEVGELVRIDPPAQGMRAGGYDPAFLTITPHGRLWDLLEQLDDCRRTYRGLIGSKVGERRSRMQAVVDRLLASGSVIGREWDELAGGRRRGRSRISEPEQFRAERLESLQADLETAVRENAFDVDRVALPRILLLGESGVGKTLVARYLAWRTSPDDGGPLSRPVMRVPIPEYLEKEEGFEYDVFGYCEGAYTDAKGFNRGYLLENIGGVVFFDEIGDASPRIQAKLLAYLDDYQVRPRGWSGRAVPCPMLVVAATNRPLEEWAAREDSEGRDRLFRHDLLRRFNMIVHVPPLNERKEELAHILDAMLQMEAFNPGVDAGKGVREVGVGAMDALMGKDYSDGNFRVLEETLRHACRVARIEDRGYLVAEDIPGASIPV